MLTLNYCQSVYICYTYNHMHDNTKTEPDIRHHSVVVPRPLRREELINEIQKEAAERRGRIDKDFENGFDALTRYSDTVTIFGSARFTEQHPYYQKSRDVASMLAEEGYTVVTGGSGGIMEGGNRGAMEAGGKALGFNILLPHEQAGNRYTTESLTFRYFFSRKVMLAFAAQAYFYFPGGFGTLDEFFEILTLIQTKKVPEAPIICVGDTFWNPLDDYIRAHLLEDFHTISPGDEKLYTITEDLDVMRQILAEHQRKVVAEVLGS